MFNKKSGLTDRAGQPSNVGGPGLESQLPNTKDEGLGSEKLLSNGYKSKGDFAERDFVKIKTSAREFARETVRLFDKGDPVAFFRRKISLGVFKPAEIIQGTGVVLGYKGGGMNAVIIVQDDATKSEIQFPIIPHKYGFNEDAPRDWEFRYEQSGVKIIRLFSQGPKVGESGEKFSLMKIEAPTA